MTILCKYCGTTNLEHSSICGGCGRGFVAPNLSRAPDLPNARRSLRIRRITRAGVAFFLASCVALVIGVSKGNITDTLDNWIFYLLFAPFFYVLMMFVDPIFLSGKKK
jgi:hypothetical protein